jgi:outer membrane protein insertion porin family
LLLVDLETQVGSVDFRFLSGSAVGADRLTESIATRAAGWFTAVREALDFLPFLSDPERPAFSPLSLQQDVVRLRRLYEVEGYPDAHVDYDVALDTAENTVDVDFVIDQGQPLLIGTIEVSWVDATADSTARDPPLPSDLQAEWRALEASLANPEGRAFGETRRANIESKTTQWLRDRGYPWATVRMQTVDTIGRAIQTVLRIDTGPRARVDAVRFEGQARLDVDVLAREIPIEPGDLYSQRDVAEGQSELYELALVTSALGGAAPGQPRDSTVTLQYRINESDPRLLRGRVGWRSESGFTGEAHWTHRNFLGGARTLTVSALAETGWAALEEATSAPNGGVSASVLQPYLGHRELSGTLGPFIRFRDDFRDRSVLYGVETAALYRPRPYQTATLQYELSRHSVDEAYELLSISDIVAQGPSTFSSIYVRSVFKLGGTVGWLDDRLDPRSGFAVEPSMEISGPQGISDVDFFRVSAVAIGAIPISDAVGLFLRGSAGRLFPYGDSDPAIDAETGSSQAYVGLRDVMFTAGGTADVRGWGAGLVGPKVPDVIVGRAGKVTAERYVPVGALNRVTGSVELALPAPFLGQPHRTFVFLDAGRVWSPGDDFEPPDEPLALEPWAFGTGAGVQIGSPFGPIRLSVGYKLNPTPVDLLPPGDVARALAAGRDLSGLATEALRRWHVHLTIGQTL